MSAVASKNNKEMAANVWGYVPIKVLSQSMSPYMNKGDLLIAKLLPGIGDIHVGDVITFRELNGAFMTHRVIDKNYENGSIQLSTKGDSNEIQDPNRVTQDQIIAKAVICIPYGGYISNFVSTPFGIFIFILLPTLFLVITEIKFIRGRMRKSEELS